MSTTSQTGAVDQIDSEDLANNLLTSIAAIRRRINRAPKPIGITAKQAALLRMIYYEPGLPAASLATFLSLIPNAISRTIRELTKLGLIVRKRDFSDHRVSHFELTDEGKAYVLAAHDFRTDNLANALDEMSREDRIALLNAAPALRALATHLAKRAKFNTLVSWDWNHGLRCDQGELGGHSTRDHEESPWGRS